MIPSKHHGNDDDGKQDFLTGSRYSNNKDDDVMTALNVDYTRANAIRRSGYHLRLSPCL